MPRPTIDCRGYALRFTPYAWAKLHWLCHHGDTEIGGFGICEDPDDMTLVTDFQLVKQECTPASVDFNDDALADFMEDQAGAGLRMDQFARVWIHTHPGSSPQPSCVDETTFDTIFGRPEGQTIMFILARGGDTYCRMKINTGFAGEMLIPVCIDVRAPFPATDIVAWEEEYDQTVTKAQTFLNRRSVNKNARNGPGSIRQKIEDLADDLDDWEDSAWWPTPQATTEDDEEPFLVDETEPLHTEQ